MEIQTKADIWNMTELEEFIRQLRGVDERMHQMNPAINTAVTGNPVQVYESSRELQLSYEKAAIYGVMIVIVVVLARLPQYSHDAPGPPAPDHVEVATIRADGTAGNPAQSGQYDRFALILGIGVDTGVQIVHDYLREPRPYRMNPSTSAALVINTLMNIVGFGALMLASHQGLHSLGRVLTLGHGLLPVELPGHAQLLAAAAGLAAEECRGRGPAC